MDGWMVVMQQLFTFALAYKHTHTRTQLRKFYTQKSNTALSRSNGSSISRDGSSGSSIELSHQQSVSWSIKAICIFVYYVRYFKYYMTGIFVYLNENDWRSTTAYTLKYFKMLLIYISVVSYCFCCVFSYIYIYIYTSTCPRGFFLFFAVTFAHMNVHTYIHTYIYVRWDSPNWLGNNFKVTIMLS